MAARATRRSAVPATGVTYPSSSSRATMRVMLGGCTCSTAASSPRVMGPSRSMLASAPWVEAVSSSPVAAASWRMRRVSRATASRSCDASSPTSAPASGAPVRLGVAVRGVTPRSLAKLISVAKLRPHRAKGSLLRSGAQGDRDRGALGRLAPRGLLGLHDVDLVVAGDRHGDDVHREVAVLELTDGVVALPPDDVGHVHLLG